MTRFSFLFLLLLLGCAREQGHQRLDVIVGIPSGQTERSSRAQGRRSFLSFLNVPSPSSLGDFNCFGVFLRYRGESPEPNLNTCDIVDSNSLGVGGINFAQKGGLAFRTSGVNSVAVEIRDVVAGLPVEIFVVGFQVSSAARCEDITNPGNQFEPGSNGVSVPYLLHPGLSLNELAPGGAPVQVAGLSFNADRRLKNCNFIGEIGNGPIPPFFTGTGSDRDVTVSTAGTDLAAVTTQALSGTKKAASRRRINGVSADGKTLSVVSFTNTDFEVGDEIVWHVLALGQPGDCGPLLRGDMLFTRVQALGSGALTLEVPLPPFDWGSVIFSQGANTAQLGSNFCNMQVHRVPHFNNLTITGGTGSLTSEAANPNGANNLGGLIAFRVAGTVFMNSGGDKVDMASKGYSLTANSMPGVSSFGAPTAADPNGNQAGGGATASFGAGGGAGSSFAGAGGDGGGTNNGGIPIPFAPPFKLTPGASGGGPDSAPNTTGLGGGLIFVAAHTSAGLFNLEAQGGVGAAGTNGGGGGGGGGAVYAFIRELQSAGGSINVSGGAGGNGGMGGGGGGGGGAVMLEYCNLSGTLPTFNSTGGAGGTGTTAGVVGMGGDEMVYPFSPCPL